MDDGFKAWLHTDSALNFWSVQYLHYLITRCNAAAMKAIYLKNGQVVKF
jgi:hypothetical protein